MINDTLTGTDVSEPSRRRGFQLAQLFLCTLELQPKLADILLASRGGGG